MPARKQSRGICQYCGNKYAKGGMARHLRACPERAKVLAPAGESARHSETLYHLRVQDSWSTAFWLDLEVRGSATLQQLDSYLRDIWLECCGHMSQFSFGGWTGDEIPMSRRIKQVFDPGATLTHIYDFGTSSETLITAADVREGVPTTKHPIALMARNVLPDVKCMECEQQATWLCLECLYEQDTQTTLCDRHVETHPHEAYGDPVPIVNSPRVGMCAYAGPAEPPY